MLRVAAALFDALRASHSPDQRRPGTHGGLCPGVLLTTADGIDKVSDFGVAPAICKVLGVDSYVNLAAGPGPRDAAEPDATGTWEVLASDEFEREDRVCSFIDPEKYGNRVLGSFEPGSDIIAAGFILHLLAEHQHPYLFSVDPEAHRLVEMSEYMAEVRYNGARRQDLRESTDPAIRAWCELVAKMLARLPQERPSSGELAHALGQHVRPVDAGEILKRRLDSVDELVQKKAWQEVRVVVKGVVDSGAAPPEVVERANALMRQADANLMLDRATELMKGDDWAAAAEPLEGLLGLPALPEEVATRAKKAAAVLKQSLAVGQELDQIEARTADDEGSDPSASLEVFQGSLSQLDKLPPEESLLPPVARRLQDVREELSSRVERATAAAQAAIEADRAQAGKWVEQLEAALEAQQWETLEGLLTERPPLRHWPEESLEAAEEIRRRMDEQRRQAAIEADRAQAEDWVGRLKGALEAQEWESLERLLAERPTLTHWPAEALKRAEAIQQACEEHLAEQRRLAAIEADRKSAEEWISPLRQAVEAEQWDQAQKVIADEPTLAHWPQELRAEADQLGDRVRTYFERQAQFERAHRWCNEFRQAVEAEQWNDAANVLAMKPTLEYWPEDVLEAEALYRAEVEGKLEAIELERRRIEEENRRITQWLERAEQAAQSEEWEKGLDILETPPDVERLPDEALAQADELKRICRQQHADAVGLRLRKRTEAVRSLAEEFVRDLVRQDLSSFLDPGAVQTTIDAEEFTSAHPEADGCARLSVLLGGDSASEADTITSPFDFQLQAEPPQVCDGQGSLRESLITQLTERLAELQKARAGELFAPLRKGVFPKVKLKLKLEALAKRAAATADLLGSGNAEAAVDTEITWDPSGLRWAYADAEAFARRAADVAAKATRTILAPKLLESSEVLRRYKSVLGFEVLSPSSLAPQALASMLPLEGRLTIQPGQASDRQTLHTFPVNCPQVGKVTLEADLAPAEANLRKLVVAVQNSAREAIAADLQEQTVAAAAKVKITAQPRRISDPVDQVTFDLKSKRHKPVTLTATWDAKAFTYQLADGLEEALAELVAAPAPGEARPRGLAAPVAIGVAAVAVLATVGYFVFRPEGESTRLVADLNGPGNDGITPARRPPPVNANQSATAEANANKARGDDEEPDNENERVSEPRALEVTAVAEVRDIFLAALGADHFSRDDVTALVELDESDPDRPRLRYRLPGLAAAETTVPLTMSEDGEAWVLSSAERDAAQQAAARLAELLSLPEELLSLESREVDLLALADVFNDAETGWDRLIEPTRVGVRFRPAAQWGLSEAGDGWTAGGVGAQVVFLPASGSGEIALADVELDVKADQGDLIVADTGEPLEASLSAQLQTNLAQRRQRSLQALTGELAAQAEAIKAEVRLPDPLPELTEALELTLRSPALQGRSFPLLWDPDELELNFEELEETTQQRVQDMTLAYQAIEQINSRPASEDDWIRRGTSGGVFEVRPPDYWGQWLLGIATQWAAPETPIEELTDAERLLIPGEWPQDGASAEQLAQAIIAGPAPNHWQLVERYLAYTADPFFLGSLAGEIPTTDGAIGYLKSDPAFVLPRLDVSGTPVLDVNRGTGLPETLQITFKPTWVLRQTPDRLDGTVLGQALQELPESPEHILLLTVTNDDQIRPMGVADLVSASESTIERAWALETRLSLWDDREQVESFIREDILPEGQNQQAIDEVARMLILREFWRVKDAPARNDLENLGSLSSDLQSTVRFEKARQARRSLYASIMVEYFCGPQDTYAVVWGLRKDVANEEHPATPILLRLCATARLLSAARSADGAGELGPELLDPVLDALPREFITAGKDAQYQLGVVLALDDPLWSIGSKLEGLALKERRSFLKEAGQRGDSLERLTRWSSLGALRQGDRRADYSLVRSLSDPTQSQPGEHELWAIDRFFKATGSGG
ncbi:MAG: hypothetical protein ACYSUQ_01360 [Planctomycetota bacterium]